jgi:hypothetical protein
VDSFRPFRQWFDPKFRLHLKTNFVSRFKLLDCVAAKSHKIHIYENQKWCILPASCSDQGAYRDRHERWRQDAMDALIRKTSEIKADGEIVWS